MVKHMISVCIFCFICATHSPCESHSVQNNIINDFDENKFAGVIREKFKERHRIGTNFRPKRDTNRENDTNYTAKIFKKYGNGDVIDLKGFEMLLNDLKAIVEENHTGNDSVS